MNKTKIIAIAAIVAAVGIFSYFIFFSSKRSPGTSENGQAEQDVSQQESASSSLEMSTSTTSTVATSSEKTTTVQTKKTTTKSPGAATLSYTNALKTYSASGYRFQFVNCRATPGSLTIKQGKTLMLDNRDGKGHTVKIGSTSYYLGAYGFAIASAKTLGINYITCDGINTAKITVEK